jgi:Na+/H+-dicarboxylate symporter
LVLLLAAALLAAIVFFVLDSVVGWRWGRPLGWLATGAAFLCLVGLFLTVDPAAWQAWRRRYRDPLWLLAIGISAGLVLVLFIGGYAIAWAFLALLLVEVFWVPSVPALDLLGEAVDRLRAWIEPLKRYPGGLVGLLLLGLGIVLGNIFSEQLGWLGTGVKSAVGGIAAAAPYIIFFTLTPAIASTIRAGGAGRFALHVNLAYLATTVIAGIFSVLMLWLLFLLRFAAEGTRGPGDTLAQIFGDMGDLMFASDPFLAIWSAVGISLLMYGFSLRGIESTVSFVGSRIVELLGDILKVTLPAILFALGVFIATGFEAPIQRAREAGTIPQGDGFVGTLSPEQAYGFAVAMLVLMLGIWMFTWSFIVMRYTRFPMKRFFFDYFADVFPYAWASSSSAATIPINLERSGEGLKVRSQVREFIIPLGATINLDGTMIGGMLTTVVAAQMVGYTPTVVDMLTILIPLTMVTVGVPGIPGGLALLAGPIIAQLLPLPPGTTEIFIAIFIGFNLGLSDQFRTGVNSVDNGLLARLFEYWFPRRYMRKGALVEPGRQVIPVPAGP